MINNLVTAVDYDTKPYQLQGVDSATVGTAFDDFITEQQDQLFVNLFGQLFYDKFSAAVASLPAVWAVGTAYTVGQQVSYNGHTYTALGNTTGNQPDISPVNWVDNGVNRWVQLLYGADYVDQNKRVYNYKGCKAFMLPFIYAMWLNDQGSQLTTLGTAVVVNSENSVDFTTSVKANTAMTRFDDLVGTQYFYYIENNQGTLYGFLYNSSALFDGDVVAESSTFKEYIVFHFDSPGNVGLNEFDF